MAELSSLGACCCAGIPEGSRAIRRKNATASTAIQAMTTNSGGPLVAIIAGATTTISTNTRAKTTVEAARITNAAASAPAGDRREERAWLTVVAVDEMSPPRMPVASRPPRWPSSLDAMYAARLMPTISTTMSQISNGLRTW